MESVLIWMIVLLFSVAIFLRYFLKFRQEHQEAIERKKEACELKIDRPRAQFPFIDTMKCIGCGSCVDACPEGDVLAVVFGKTTVVNGLRCVGHGNCEEACPVGAIEVGLGDIKKRHDIPVLTKNFESNIPGIYIVGELGGLSLIRNAIRQGNTALEHIAQTVERSTRSEVYDVIIVGAGPAGLSAALCAIKNKLNYVVIDQNNPGVTILQYPRQKLVLTQPVEIPLYGKLNKSEIQKEELLQIWNDIIKKYDIQIQYPDRVIDIKQEEDKFLVITRQGQYFGKRVVLALGRRGTPRKLGVPGENSSKVMYQLIDAQSYQNNHILVVGGGDSAVEAAIGLARQKDNKVYISYRKPKFFRIKKKNAQQIEELIQRKKVIPLFNSHVTKIEKNHVELIQEEVQIRIPNDFVFVLIGGEPPFDFLKKIGIKFGSDLVESEKLEVADAYIE